MSIAPADLERAGLRLDIDTREQAAGAGAAAAVATVTLDRPRRRNAMTPGMWRGLAGIGRALPPEVRVVVIRGAGETFSAGIDLRLLSAEGVAGEEPLPDPRGAGFEAWIADCQAGFSWLRRPEIVSVAAVRGHAIGAGFQLALSCDLRVFADDAATARAVKELLGRAPRHTLEEQSAAERRIQAELQRERLKG